MADWIDHERARLLEEADRRAAEQRAADAAEFLHLALRLYCAAALAILVAWAAWQIVVQWTAGAGA